MEPLTPPEPVSETAIRIDSHLESEQERSLADDVAPMNQPAPRSAIETTAAPARDRPIRTSPRVATHPMHDARYAANFSLTRPPFVAVQLYGAPPPVHNS